jgi:hypothetical protein
MRARPGCHRRLHAGRDFTHSIYASTDALTGADLLLSAAMMTPRLPPRVLLVHARGPLVRNRSHNGSLGGDLKGAPFVERARRPSRGSVSTWDRRVDRAGLGCRSSGRQYSIGQSVARGSEIGLSGIEDAARAQRWRSPSLCQFSEVWAFAAPTGTFCRSQTLAGRRVATSGTHRFTRSCSAQRQHGIAPVSPRRRASLLRSGVGRVDGVLPATCRRAREDDRVHGPAGQRRDQSLRRRTRSSNAVRTAPTG